MNATRKAAHNAAAKLYAMRAKGGPAEAKAQAKAMSKTKRARFRRTKKG
jgi:hypothetical protein